MPSSLIVVALVVAWLVVLVPMIVRKRQEIARTADSALAARVVRKGNGAVEEPEMRETEPSEGIAEVEDGMDSTTEAAPPLDIQAEADDRDPVDTDTVSAPTPQAPRRYRPGRGGFDPEAAALTARAKYAFRQRVVVAMLLFAVGSAITAAVVTPVAWWAHGLIDIGLVTYLAYLRRQVRIEEEIRQRRMARMDQARRITGRVAEPPSTHDQPAEERHEPVAKAATPPPRVTHPHAVVVDIDDEDPAFDELEDPHNLRYRRAVGE
ncbi:gephyrin-like molybdotransferase receptor GlpR [Actinocrispum wychmicini]|uniref:Uncharacterized protein n=1 Tax=Actinocrispum wychmicini TaxID=1213861 RepID=A0A4R2JMM5_9PSEU|nr:gephyrin-like molybdotransferase receptor GlpR [Actinocrispum wychmicini]TCO58376.1 hypothetical protein EV192_105444 [Actinocrispum wychmicini]